MVLSTVLKVQYFGIFLIDMRRVIVVIGDRLGRGHQLADVDARSVSFVLQEIA
jgi:hypothetical protein